MNEKKLSSLTDKALSDKHIEEAADAESFFAHRRAALLRRKLLMKIIPIVAACLVLTIVLSIGSMLKSDKEDKADEDSDSDLSYDSDWSDTYVPDGSNGWFDNPDLNQGDNTEECIVHEDADEDLKCDVCGADVPKPWSPWDEVKYFAVPNTSAVINVIDVDEAGLVKNIQLAKGSTMIFEFDYTASAAASSFEMKFDAETVKVAFGADGKIAILKGETELAVSTEAYTGTANVAVDWNGAKIAVKVNNVEAVSADYTAPETNAKLYLIAGEGAKFENAKATLGGSAIEFETRSGTTWELITEDGDNKNALYTGYDGTTANNYKCLALINNFNFDNASKITISANIAIGADWRVVNPDGTTSGNGDRGFVIEVWNTNGENGTSPLFYENKETTSFLKVYLSGYGVSVGSGKFGATTFADPGCNRDNGWNGLPNGSAGTPGRPEEVTILNDGKNEEGQTVYKTENTFEVGKYTEFKVEWDRVNYILSYYYNGTLAMSYQFSKDIFVNDGSGIGIVSASGDTYFKDINLIVE